MARDSQYIIEVIDVMFDVIEHLHQAADGPLGASEIARHVGINRSRAFRILKTLERRGYVEADPQTQGYHLGLKFLEIGEGVRERLDLRHAAQPILTQLTKMTGEAASLLVLHGQMAVCVERSQGENMLQVAPSIGEFFPLYIGACPKILLAHLPAEERERIIKEIEFTPYTPNTITNPDDLRRSLEQIRSQGYAVDEEDYERGVYAIGAPVRDYTGAVIAGLSIAVPKSRYNAERREQLIERIIDGAMEISLDLGFMPKRSAG